jgi:hypothetical protein
MSNELLHFHCPACGIRLSVPMHLAGVNGPCPSCGASIEAPAIRPSPDAGPAKPPPAGREDAPPTLRCRAAAFISRILMPMILLMATVALVYGVLTLLKGRLPASSSQSATTEKPADDSPSLADGLEPVSLWHNADATLDKFLAASDLAGRMPLMESAATEKQLAATCLAKPLPAVIRMVPEFRETDAGGDRVDHFYSVEFQTTDKPSGTHTMLVRTRGDDPPKVMADAFLDTYGGRLARYAANSSDEEGVFRAVVYAVAGCTDPTIPNHENKLTLKLMSCDNGREIASASFSRDSAIAKMLEDGTYKLTYGKSRPCTVKLRWNTEQGPGRPFLEAVAIRDYGWDS